MSHRTTCALAGGETMRPRPPRYRNRNPWPTYARVSMSGATVVPGTMILISNASNSLNSTSIEVCFEERELALHISYPSGIACPPIRPHTFSNIKSISLSAAIERQSWSLGIHSCRTSSPILANPSGGPGGTSQGGALRPATQKQSSIPM